MKLLLRQESRLIVTIFFLFLYLSSLNNQTLAADKATENLARSVTIYRDTFGVPHIYGRSDASVVFGLMYAQAEDNFWQLEEDHINKLGRASEIYGDSRLTADLMSRLFETSRRAQEEYKGLSP